MRPKKRFGQNFLNNPAVLSLIRKRVEESGCNFVLEIGGGTGVLTRVLADVADVDLKVIELDRDLVPILVGIAGEENVIEGNVLDIPLDMGDNMFVAGNIPYYITKPIIMKIKEYRRYISHALLMVQREVGEGITSSPGVKGYNAFTVLSQLYFKTSYVRTVKKGSFFPPPKVDSALISLETRDEVRCSEIGNEDLIFESFRERRKTLANNLKRIYDKERIEACLKDLDIKDNARAEDLGVEKFRDLMNYFDDEGSG